MSGSERGLTCVILAGGQSSRMPGEQKAFTRLGEQALVQIVLQRIITQTENVLINVQQPTQAFSSLGYPLVPDLQPGYRGPLMGLYSSLCHMVNNDLGEWLLLVPCDAPFLPLDLGEILRSRAQGAGLLCATASWQGYRQPTFSVWHRDLLEPLRQAVIAENKGGLKQFLGQEPHEVVAWPEQHPPPFHNVNTADDLLQAQQWLDAG